MYFQGTTLYYSDSIVKLVRRIDFSKPGAPSIETIAGKQPTLPSDPSLGDGGTATNAYINGPAQMVADKGGNYLLLVQVFDYVVRKIMLSSLTITTVAGVIPRNSDYNGVKGGARSMTLNYPTGVAMDSEGLVYISDTRNNVIRKLDLNTNIISTIAGQQYINDAFSCSRATCFSGDGGLAVDAIMFYPAELFIINGEIIFNDSRNKRIRKISTNGIITTIYQYSSDSYVLQTYGDVPYVSDGKENIYSLTSYCDSNYILNNSLCYPCPKGTVKVSNNCVPNSLKSSDVGVISTDLSNNTSNVASSNITWIIVGCVGSVIVFAAVAVGVGIFIIVIVKKRNSASMKYKNLQSQELNESLNNDTTGQAVFHKM